MFRRPFSCLRVSGAGFVTRLEGVPASDMEASADEMDSRRYHGPSRGSAVFVLAWSVLVAWLAKAPADKALPRWLTSVAMGIAFAVVALSWSGFFRDVLPIFDEI
jgi:hypothetical protein